MAEIQKVRYSHDGMIDVLIAEPMISQGQLAAMFGYTQAWVSQVINSDAFQARLTARKSELTDPAIVKSIEERLRAVAQKSLDVVLAKLEHSDYVKPGFALAAAQMSSRALGYGAPAGGPGSQSGPAVVINLPGVAPTAEAWASRHAPPAPAQLVEEVPTRDSAPPPVDHEKARVYL